MEPMTRRSSAAFAVLVGLAAIPLLASLASVPRAHSAFPGKNGFIAFSKLRHGSYDIYRMRPNGKGLRRLTNSPENDAAPAPDYSPNGKLIAYDSGGLGRTGYSHIFVTRANGTHQRQITHGNVVDGDPSFSGPHATRIAFASDRGHGHRYGIFIMRADGSHIKQLAGSRRKSAIQPAFSPNGKKVAYTDGDPNDFYDIYVMRADGSHKKRLTKWPYSDDSPSWSPSGKRIIFDRRVGIDSQFELFVMRANGTHVRRLTHHRRIFFGLPEFSPNGRKVAFEAGPNIAVMRADGSHKHTIKRHGTDDAPELGREALKLRSPRAR